MELMTVPTSSIVNMFIMSALAFLIPITLGIAWKKRTGGSIKPMLVGAATFVIFAQVLEALCHVLFLQVLPTAAIINSNFVLYAAYGGAMAGIFEECGRLVAFAFVLKKYREKTDAISYGIGHGGIECIMVLGVNMLVYAIVSIAANGGTSADVLAAQFGGIDGLNTALQTAAGVNVLNLVLAVVERICAIALHICLSMFVFSAVKNKKDINFFIAVLIHFLFDFVAVLISNTLGILVTEGVLILMTAGIFYYTFKVKKGDV